MTADDFNAAIAQLGISRAELCRRLGLSLNTGTAYANGRAAIPTYIALAISALLAGLPPYGSEPEKSAPRR
jgi:transcriptional regulator with XRE-family HTH domain